MNDTRAEQLLEWRPVVLWAWLMISLVSSRLDPEPIAACLGVAGVLFAAERWSSTVRRASAVALLLLDAPAVFLIQPPPPLSGVLFALVLAGGVLTLRRSLALGLMLQVSVMQALLLARSPTDLVASSASAVALALVGWALWRAARPAAG